MNLPARLLELLEPEPGPHVLEASLIWTHPWIALTAAVLLTAVLIASSVLQKSQAADLRPVHRRVLALLRLASIAVIAVILAQPVLLRHLERSQPRQLAILVQANDSMDLRDGPEPAPSSRSERAAALVKTLDAHLLGPTSRPATLAQQLSAAEAEARNGLTAGILLLGDGFDPDPTSALAAARRLGRAGIPVTTCLAANEHPRDLAIELATDAELALTGEPVPIRVHLRQDGFAGRTATLELRTDGKTVERKQVTLSSDLSTSPFEIRLETAGLHRIEAHVQPLPYEITTVNNTAALNVQAIDGKPRVLCIERWPRWQYRFLQQSLEADPHVETTFVLTGPRTGAAGTPVDPLSAVPPLSSFDLVILGDLNGDEAPAERWLELRDHVIHRGAGLIFAAGPAYGRTMLLSQPLADLLPIEEFDDSEQTGSETVHTALTPLGREHPLLRLAFGPQPEQTWKELPPLTWLMLVRQLRPGAAVLATAHPDSTTMPLLAIQHAGRGPVLLVGTDETWRWRLEVGDRYFDAFWRQAVHQLALPHLTTRLGVADERQRGTGSEPLAAGGGSNVSGRGACPLLPWQPDPRLLRDVAAASGGRFVRPDELPAAVARMDLSPLTYRWWDQTRVMNHGLTLALLGVLLGVEWTLRKRWYLP